MEVCKLLKWDFTEWILLRVVWLASCHKNVLPQTANVDLVNALLGTGRGLLSSGGLVDSLVGLTFFFFFTPQVSLLTLLWLESWIVVHDKRHEQQRYRPDGSTRKVPTAIGGARGLLWGTGQGLLSLKVILGVKGWFLWKVRVGLPVGHQ